MFVHSITSLAPISQTYTGGPGLSAVFTPPTSYENFLSRPTGPTPCSLNSDTSDRTTQRKVLDYISFLTADLIHPSTLAESSPGSDLSISEKEHEQDAKTNSDKVSSCSGIHTSLENAFHTALCSKQVRPFSDGDDHLADQGSGVRRPAELDQETWETIMHSLRELEPKFWKALQNRVCQAKVVKTHRRHLEGGRNGPVLLKRKKGKSGVYALAIGIPVGLLVLLLGGVMYANKHRRELARSAAGTMDDDMELGPTFPPRSQRHRYGPAIPQQ